MVDLRLDSFIVFNKEALDPIHVTLIYFFMSLLLSILSNIITGPVLSKFALCLVIREPFASFSVPAFHFSLMTARLAKAVVIFDEWIVTRDLVTCTAIEPGACLVGVFAVIVVPNDSHSVKVIRLTVICI